MTSRLIRRAAPITALLVLWGCGSYPLPKVYVLGDPAPAVAGVAVSIGQPVIELETVRVPDYLDSTDIVRRTGANQVNASPAGRWGERLSVGMTRALLAALSPRLPAVTIENRGAYEPTRRLLVDVERFEIEPSGRCALAARWRLTDADGKVLSPSEEATFVRTANSASDADAAAAMTLAIDDLAGRIAVTVAGALGKPG